MRVLVVYDSVFGNTEKIARAIANALGSPAEVAISRAGEVTAEQLEGLDLLVVGSPTRGFRPTDAITAFLRETPAKALKGIKVAAFDTRIAESDIKNPVGRFFFVRLGSYAGKPIAEGLVKKGGELAVPPEGFYVEDTEGPLKPGELERAAGWGGHLRAA